MPKHFFNPEQMKGDELIIAGDTAHHLLGVLRISVGDTVIFCDGKNQDYFTVLREIKKSSKSAELFFEIANTEPCRTEPSVYLTLYQSLPKSDKMDLIITKCVELGASEIVPILAERSAKRFGDGDIIKKNERYRRISESAAGQCMRGVIPLVKAPCTFEQAVTNMPADLCLVADENENGLTLNSFLRGEPVKNRVGIWIGPEGSFTENELKALKNSGAVPVSLGRRILRTETAAISSVAQIISSWSEI